MADIRRIVQKLLDKQLLENDGICSFHMRREKVTKVRGLSVEINPDEYVIYRVVSSSNYSYGDGNAIIEQYQIEVNYYYAAEKTKETRRRTADSRVKEIQSAILKDPHFRLSVGQNDIYDIDNPFRGINMQFSYYGAKDNG